MKKIKRRNRVVASILAVLLVLSMLLGSVVTVFADEVKIVTLGADLSAEEKELILNYFNVNEKEVEIITVTNEDEHFYLDGIATQQQIGRRTYSCTYIEPTNEGGIHIKTVNLNWATCNMIRNALVTSGITNCNVICAAPKEVSGTGALTGIFMAYESATNEELDKEKIELASQELVETMALSEDIGHESATSMISLIKEEVIVNSLDTAEEIGESLEEYIKTNNIELTEEQKESLIQLMLDISEQDYSVDDVKQAYQDIKDNVQKAKDTAEEAMGFFEKIWNWLVTIWQKITGTYEKVMATEEAQMVKDQLGILAQTNDSLLGSDTVVTVTEEQSLLDEAATAEEEVTEEEKTGIIDSIVNFFKGDTDKSSEVTTETPEENKEDSITFDSIQEMNVEEYDEVVDTEVEKETEVEEDITETEVEEENKSILDYVNWEMQNEEETEEEVPSGTPSLDDLTS